MSKAPRMKIVFLSACACVLVVLVYLVVVPVVEHRSSVRVLLTDVSASYVNAPLGEVLHSVNQMFFQGNLIITIEKGAGQDITYCTTDGNFGEMLRYVSEHTGLGVCVCGRRIVIHDEGAGVWGYNVVDLIGPDGVVFSLSFYNKIALYYE